MEHQAPKEILPIDDIVYRLPLLTPSLSFIFIYSIFWPRDNFNVVFRQYVVYAFVLP